LVNETKDSVYTKFYSSEKSTESSRPLLSIWYPTDTTASVVSYQMMTYGGAAVESDVDDVDDALDLVTYDTLTVTEDEIDLPSSVGDGVTVTWSSGNEAVVADDGTITTPADDVDVTLTATFTKNSDSTTKEFIFVIEGDGVGPADTDTDTDTDDEDDDDDDSSTSTSTDTDTDTETTTTTKTTKVVTVATKATLSDEKVAKVVVAESSITAAIESFSDEDADNKKVVNIVVDSVEGAKGASAQFPASVMKTAQSAAVAAIAIETEFGTIEVPTNAFDDYLSDDSGDIEIAVSELDEEALADSLENAGMTAEEKAKVLASPVYDFNAFVGYEKVSSFGGQKINISIDYDLKEGEDPDSIVVYYINDEGKLETVKASYYNAETGKISFKVKHFSKYAIMANNVTFNDLSAVSWAENSINALASRGIVSGVGNEMYNPEGNVTRAEFIKMLMNTLDLVDDTATTTFTDVAEGEWYYSYIASAQALGITNGYEDGRFGVDDEITREDMVALAYRATIIAEYDLDATTTAITFADSEVIADYAVTAVEYMQEAGIVSGVGYNTFAPKAQTTRAESAVLMYNLFKSVQ
jgi:hypothetical protein